MADLTFDSLAKDYSQFRNYASKITINGTTIEESVGTVENLTVELTAFYDASSCSLEISERGLEHKNELVQLTDEMRGVLALGNIVEVELGYGTKFKKVFKGYIDSTELSFTQEEGLLISIECLDAKGIMMNNYKSGIKKDIETFSEAVEKILKDYSSIANKRKVTSTEALTVPIEQHNESDYEFVVRIAKKLNYGFYIINGEIFFEPMGSQDNDQIEIDSSRFLYGFSMKKTLDKMVSKVIARNNNESDPTKAFEGTAESFKGLDSGTVSPSDISKVLSKAVTRTIIDPSINSEEEAKAIAEAALNRLSLNMVQGEVTFVGVPDIQPGKFLSIKGFGKEYDKKYYVTKVKHVMGAGGYFTVCTLGGNKV